MGQSYHKGGGRDAKPRAKTALAPWVSRVPPLLSPLWQNRKSAVMRSFIDPLGGQISAGSAACSARPGAAKLLERHHDPEAHVFVSTRKEASFSSSS